MALTATVGRLRSYWSWWRLGLLLATCGLLAIAFAVDSRWLSALVGAVAITPVAVLVSLTGDRMDRVHRQLPPLERRIDRALASASVEERHARLPLPQRAAVSVLVGIQPRTSPGRNLEALMAELSGTEVVLIDRTRSTEVAGELLELMHRYPTIRYAPSDPASDLIADFDQVRRLVSGRYLLALRRGAPPRSRAGEIRELLSSTPGGHERMIGARISASGEFGLVNAAALDAIGGWTDEVGAPDSVRERLGAAGFTTDVVGGTRIEEPRPVHAYDLSRPHVGETTSELAGSAVLIVDSSASAATMLALELEAGSAVLLVDHPTWEECRHRLLRSPLTVRALPPAGDWIRTVGCVVGDPSGAGQSHLEIARQLGVTVVPTDAAGHENDGGSDDVTGHVRSLVADAIGRASDGGG